MGDRRQAQPATSGFRSLVSLALLWLLAYGLIVGLTSQNAVPYEQLLLDPSSSNGLPWYTGLVSNLGILGWTTATVTAAGGAWLSSLGNRVGPGRLLRGGALLSMLLMLDDLFQLHIVVSNAVGVGKTVAYVIYVVLAGWWVLENQRELRRTRWPLAMAAGMTFAASIGVDRLGDGAGIGLVAEDGFKFLGILAWALYFTWTAGEVARSVVAAAARERHDAPASANAANEQRSDS